MQSQAGASKRLESGVYVFNNIGIEDVHGKREMPVLVDYGAEDEGARRIVHAAGTAESPWGEDAVVSVFVRFVEQCAKGAAEDVGGFAWCKRNQRCCGEGKLHRVYAQDR